MHSARPRLRLPSGRPTRLVADAVVVGAAAAVVIGLSRAPQLGGALPQPAAGQALVLAAAGAAAAASLLGALTARLIDDPRTRWIAAALALYAVAVLPSSAYPPAGSADLSSRGTPLLAYLVTMGLLVAAVRPPPRMGAIGTWTITVAGALLALGLPAAAPTLVGALIAGPITTVAVLVGWTAVAAAVVIEGYRRRSSPRWRVGLGLVVLAAAQLHRVLTTAPGQSAGNLVFAGLRLFSLLVIVAGLGQLVVRTLVDLRSQQFQQQEELAIATLHLERAGELAAERDHELRNGLAGLAGITHLLGSRSDDPDHERLRHAVLAELGRLHTILDGGPVDDGDPDATDSTGYAVEPVLAGLVTLRRTAGSDVELDVEAGLRARGHSAVLAQVVTNLLANCERHAPGSPITVHAHRRGDCVVVDVRDQGPGLPVQQGGAAALLRRGVRDAGAGGSGLGLHISRQLVEREGGTLGLRTNEAPRGCVATVTLPAVAISSDAAVKR